MNSYMSLPTFEAIEVKKDASDSFYELIESENESRDFPIFQNPLFCSCSPIYNEKIDKYINKDNKIIKKKKCHGKNETDNLIRKIQVHYISFIRSFINEIIMHLNINKKFLKIDYKIKKILIKQI